MDIDRLIPHRPPFRFVDEVVRVDPESGEFLLNLSATDPRLSTGRLAPLLVVEALAQAAAAFHGASQCSGGPETGMLVQLAEVKLMAAAAANDRVSLRVTRSHTLGDLVRFIGQATVNGRSLVSAELTVARQRGES